MKILVAIARTPDTTAPIDFVDNGKKYKEEGVQFIINPYDEFALAKAMDLKDERQGVEVTVITVDSNKADQLLRKALAIGADKAVRIDVEPEDAWQTAGEIVEWIKKSGEQFDLIFTGKETINYNGGLVGGYIASLLGYTYIPETYKLNITDDGKLDIIREIEGGRVFLKADMPAVITAVEYLAEPRLPSMRGIMQARTKPFSVEQPTGIEPLTTTVKHYLPSKRKECKLIDPENIEELVEILHKEIKVL